MRIFLPLNSICNFNCSYCVASCNTDDRLILNPNQARYYKKNKYMNFVNYHFTEDDVISFSGGEPSHYLNRDLAFYYMRNTNIKFELMTNLSDVKFVYQVRNNCKIIYATLHRSEMSEEDFINNILFLIRKGIRNIVVKEILFPSILDKQLQFRNLIYSYGLSHEFEKFKPYKEGYYTQYEKSLLKTKKYTIGQANGLCQCSSDHDTIMINFNGDISKCWYMTKPFANIIKDDFPIDLNYYLKEEYMIEKNKPIKKLNYIYSKNTNLFENINNINILK